MMGYRIIVLMFTIFLSQHLQPAQSQPINTDLPRPFNIAIESRWGIQRELMQIKDPAGYLASRANPRAFYGIGLSASTRHPQWRAGINIDYSFIGREIGFRGYGQQPGSTFWRFQPFAEYQLPFHNYRKKSKMRLVLQAGPSFNSTLGRAPGPMAENNFNYTLTPNGDTMNAILFNSNLLRSSMWGLSASAGLAWQANHRLSLLLTTGAQWAWGGTVATQQVDYRILGMPARVQAKATNSGSMFVTTLGIRYAIGTTEKTLERRKRQGRRGIDTAFLRTHRWEAELLTSSFYPTINLSDPGGHLAPIRLQRFTYGARLRFRVAPRWFVSAGFETFPYALEAWPDNNFFLSRSTIAANVANAVQVPVMAEYLIWRTTNKIKIDIMAGMGMCLGIQRRQLYPDYIPRVRLPGDVNTHPQSIYYEDVQLQEGPGKTYWAATAQLQAKLHVSRHIYLHGYLRYQRDLTGQTHFMRMWAAYRYGSPSAPEHKALLGQSPTTFLPGFGVGFKF